MSPFYAEEAFPETCPECGSMEQSAEYINKEYRVCRKCLGCGIEMRLSEPRWRAQLRGMQTGGIPMNAFWTRVLKERAEKKARAKAKVEAEAKAAAGGAMN